MEYDIDRFAEMNFNHFSPEEKKLDFVLFLGIALGIVGVLSLYYYTENKRNKDEADRKKAELYRLQSELENFKQDNSKIVT